MEHLTLATDVDLPVLNPAPGPGTKLSMDHALETRRHSGAFEMDPYDEAGNAQEVEYGELLAMKHDAHQMNMGWNVPKKKAAKKKRRQAKAKSAAAALEAIGALNTNAPPIPSGLLKPQVPIGDDWAQAAEDANSTLIGTVSATSAGATGSTDFDSDPQDQEDLASVLNMQDALERFDKDNDGRMNEREQAVLYRTIELEMLTQLDQYHQSKELGQAADLWQRLNNLRTEVEQLQTDHETEMFENQRTSR